LVWTCRNFSSRRSLKFGWMTATENAERDDGSHFRRAFLLWAVRAGTTADKRKLAVGHNDVGGQRQSHFPKAASPPARSLTLSRRRRSAATTMRMATNVGSLYKTPPPCS